MPISQDRVLRLLAEYQSFHDEAKRMRAEVLEVLTSGMSAAAQLTAIMDITYPLLPACVWLEVEQEHFKRAGARNVKSRERMRRSRNASGSVATAQEGRQSDV